MGKGWPFHKTKNNQEASSSRDGKKKEQDLLYIPMDHARKLFNEDHAVPLPDVNLPAVWLLNSWRELVPAVPREGQERRGEIRCRCFILPPDPHEYFSLDIDSFN
jgi:hypothetical protein